LGLTERRLLAQGGTLRLVRTDEDESRAAVLPRERSPVRGPQRAAVEGDLVDAQLGMRARRLGRGLRLARLQVDDPQAPLGVALDPVDPPHELERSRGG